MGTFNLFCYTFCQRIQYYIIGTQRSPAMALLLKKHINWWD